MTEGERAREASANAAEDLLAALRAGDESAFATLVDRYSGPMTRIAMTHVRTRAVAEEVVQETWLGVIKGLDRFEGRSSLSTWIFRILTNTAKTRGEREARSVPFSSMTNEDEAAVDPDRFFGPGERWAGHWREAPSNWESVPESRLLATETRARLEAAVEALPPVQRTVISLRDIEGWTSEEVCNVLELSETNQRVLLHRARSRVRAALEEYVTDPGAGDRAST